MFVMVMTVLALMRIIWMICSRKYKRHTITVIDLSQDNCNSAQAIYTSVIAPSYFYHTGNLNLSTMNIVKPFLKKNKN